MKKTIVCLLFMMMSISIMSCQNSPASNSNTNNTDIIFENNFSAIDMVYKNTPKKMVIVKKDIDLYSQKIF
jgi:hypothetical protein